MFILKKLLVILIITFSFLSWTQADDDIRDFQIEGISIGDSALEFFSKKELKNAHEIHDYKNKKFRYYFLSYKNSQTYEYLQISVIPSDEKFIIHGIDGHIFYENNIDDCYKKMNSVKKEISNILNKNSIDDQGSHPSFKNSSYKRSLFRFKIGFAELVCYDMSKKSNKTDRFAITLKNSRFGKFLTEEAYN